MGYPNFTVMCSTRSNPEAVARWFADGDKLRDRIVVETEVSLAIVAFYICTILLFLEFFLWASPFYIEASRAAYI